MMSHALCIGLAAAAVLCAPAGAIAQTESETVQDALGFLVTNRAVQTNDFERDREAADATRDTLTRALLSAIAQVPISTSSSGFSYRLNPSLGTVERASETFGPFFVERALTSGHGQASFGVTFQYASFNGLDGYELDDGSFVTVANQFVDETRPFDVETLTLNISTRTTTVFGNIGVTDRIDISAAVPFVALSVRGSRTNTYYGESSIQARATADTTGVADIAVRSKVRLTADGPANAAAGVEVRLPTGRDEDLLGAGELALRLLGIGSAEFGPTSVHGNFIVGVGGLGREISFGGAVAHAATPRFTVVGEVLARRLAGAHRITEVVAPHPRYAEVNTMRLMPVGEEQLAMLAAAGFKWNVSRTWLLQANLLLPIGERGLTSRLAPTVAVDYSFTR